MLIRLYCKFNGSHGFVTPVFEQSNLKLVEVIPNHHFDEKEFNHLNTRVITSINHACAAAKTEKFCYTES